MLPLLQMHPQMGQGPPHFDHLPSFQSHLNPDFFPLHQQPHVPRSSNTYQNAGPSQRAFPIRVSQPAAPALHRITTSFIHSRASDNNEYSLRRKTPNGTIDNGYDGSMTHLASGPPALKHMIVPANSKIYPTAVVQRPQPPNPSATAQARPIPTPGWPYSASPATNNQDQAIDSLNSALASFGGWATGQTGQGLSPGDHTHATHLQSMSQHNYQHPPTMQSILGPAYHQNLSPTVFSPAGFQQSSLWRDGGVSDYRPSVPLAQGFIPQNAAVDSAFIPPQPTIHPGLTNGPPLGHALPFRMHLSNHPLDDGFSRYAQANSAVNTPNHRLEALSLSSGTPGPSPSTLCDSSSNARFKERALAQAHKTYADLLIYLSHSRKAHSKLGLGSRSSSRMVVFPRPPKQLSASLTQARPRPSHALTGLTGMHTQNLAQKPAHPSRAFTYGGRPTDPRSMGVLDRADQHAAGLTPVTAEILGNPSAHNGIFAGSNPHCDMSSPLLSARASLEVLSNLCEHSGWKWTDGMLLGGCLHYGLEHYEEALDWFKRIISLDESHVEAISNIAATLYCLNRQEEAEQHWVQAVKIRPSYLEAVEHLVGLLCSNQRSQEAVNTISFVQRVLKMPQSGSARDVAGETASDTGVSAGSSVGDQVSGFSSLDVDNDSSDATPRRINDDNQPGFGSSGYAIPGNENGRMLLLIHAKGNMLYALKAIDRASEAFEEAVLVSTGRKIQGVQSLIRLIQVVLTPKDGQGLPSRTHPSQLLTNPLLLPPEKAKHTAQLVFSSSNGQLPGLRYIPDGTHKKAAVSTTSNSLLSLAKIFQDAMSTGGSTPGLMRQPTGVGDILALYYLSLSLQESPSTANNVGILLASVQQPVSQQVTTTDAALCQTIPGIVPGSGLALALAYYHYGLSLDPKHVHLHTNLGSLLKDIGQLDSAIHMYEKAVQCDGTFDIALTNLANAVKDRGRINDAIVYYKRAVHSNPDFAEAVCGLSTALNSVCDWRDRGGVILYGGKHDRWHVDAAGMLADARNHGRGSGLMKRVVDIVGRQLKEASSWGRGTLQENTLLQLAAQLSGGRSNPGASTAELITDLRRWSGQPWEGSRILRLIERFSRIAMRDWYLDKHVRGVQSASSYQRPKLPASLSIPSAPTVLPFHTFTCPLTAKDIRMISQRNALRISCSTLRSPWLPASVFEPPGPPSPHLNVGYVSSDFNNHPLAHLMQSVFGFHDPRRAKAFCYATTAGDRSIHRQQIEREAPVFRDVSSWTSDRLVNQIVADGIHILVNLNGYTRGARNEIFAARPAPIQMSFMGFAGTLGSEWCDYLLADSTAIPPSTLRPHRDNLTVKDVFRDEDDCEADGWIYSENIIFCKDTFFCCDHAQSADGSGDRDMTWEEEQRRRWKMRKELFPSLPDDKIIMGNFNQLYKIDPTTFRTWLRILDAVPNAVLWLLRFPELGESNLKRTARQWAGEEVAKRIIFTDVAPKQQHISRARVCDLFLDTPECNAHTTSADVLWSSTPLLTLPRYQYKMCSRMAASILKGALPKSPDGERAAKELIAADDAEYENSAIRLASNLSYNTSKGYGEGSGRLAELRQLLWSSKWSCALFDTRRWVRDLEDAYEEAWRRWVAGEGGDIYL